MKKSKKESVEMYLQAQSCERNANEKGIFEACWTDRSNAVESNTDMKSVMCYEKLTPMLTKRTWR